MGGIGESRRGGLIFTEERALKIMAALEKTEGYSDVEILEIVASDLGYMLGDTCALLRSLNDFGLRRPSLFRSVDAYIEQLQDSESQMVYTRASRCGEYDYHIEGNLFDFLEMVNPYGMMELPPLPFFNMYPHHDSDK